MRKPLLIDTAASVTLGSKLPGSELQHVQRHRATKPSLTAQCCRWPGLGHAAVRPIIADFRRNRKIRWRVNSHNAVRVSFGCSFDKDRFADPDTACVANSHG